MKHTRDGFGWAAVPLLALLLVLPLAVPAHEGEDSAAPKKPGAVATAARADIEEKLGTLLPAGVTFVDAEGNVCDLKAQVTRPTILALVYYGCTGECNLVLDSLTEVLRKIPQKPGTDFQVISVSFDETETPPMASRKRDNMMNLLGPAFPRDAWLFLVGNGKSIDALTDAVGFHFIRQENGIAHSTALVFLAPGGKIVRYLHGTEYLPAEVSLALTEAEAGKIGISARKMLSYCFSYDPASRRYTANLLRAAGVACVIGVGILLWLLLRPRKNRQNQPGNTPEKV